MQTLRKTVLRGTHNLASSIVLIDMIFSVQEFFDLRNRKSNNHPVLRRCVLDLVETNIVVLEPFVNSVQRVLRRSNKSIDLIR